MALGFDHYQALAARGARFDGLFFVGVKTTGLYCRPGCARVAHGASASDLAAVTDLSAGQLRRLFARAFGVTPVAVVQTERLLFAKKLLQQTCLPMIDAAFGAGFRSVRWFNALFRARYGLAPTALRRTERLTHRTGGGSAVPADALTPPGQASYFSKKLFLACAEAWRPWRAYAAVHLWQGLSQPSSP